MEGLVFDIQRGCIHDGPGIRTTIFLKGCNLRCRWCHNPESFSFSPQLSFTKKKCSLCAKCANVCACGVHTFTALAHNVDFEKCSLCGKCVSACNTNALKIIGEKMNAIQVIEEAIKDLPYYMASGGGVTFSGGEPSCQIHFLTELLRISKQHGLHTAVETNGFWDAGQMRPLLEMIDLFLLDFKHFDPAEHMRYTGTSPGKWYKNVDFLEAEGKDVLLRCPIIPGVNDTDAHLTSIKALAAKHKNILGFEIMPYHSMGAHKRAELGLCGEE